MTTAATNKDMHISAAALQLLKNYEGLGPIVKSDHWYPYHGKKDKPGVMTLGYGNVVSGDALKYYSKNGITEQEATELLKLRIAKEFEPIVKRNAPHVTDQAGFDSLVVFSYNNGDGPFTPGHDLRTAIDTGDKKKIAAAILEYICDGNKQPCDGLIRRRATEAHLQLFGVYIFANTRKLAIALLDKMTEAGALNLGIADKKDRYNLIRDPGWKG